MEKKYAQASGEELNEMIRAASQQLHDLRFQVAANQLKPVRKIRVARKDLARLKTVLRNR